MSDKNKIPILPPTEIGWEEIPEGGIHQKYIAQGISVTMGNLPKEIGNEFDNIEKEIRESNFTNAKPQNDRLVGHLKKEFQVPKHLRSDTIKSFLIWMADVTLSNDIHFKRYFKLAGLPNNNVDCNKLLDADQFWVNYQKKYEFNPVHNHVGILSWVVWNKIPYNVKDEFKMFPSVGGKKGNLTSSFNFIFEGGLGNVAQFPILVDKKMQNYICMFPSYLNHLVYPFYTSDDYRVSFSGNIFLTT
tara:strand:+ start:1032 stop:1766 length:735 start_codon:yes stop_codon:yes gene_type:complete